MKGWKQVDVVRQGEASQAKDEDGDGSGNCASASFACKTIKIGGGGKVAQAG
jgi:hypothetical protein